MANDNGIVFLALQSMREQFHTILEQEYRTAEIVDLLKAMGVPATAEFLVDVQRASYEETRVLLARTEAEISRRCVWRTGGAGPIEVEFDTDQWDDGHPMYLAKRCYSNPQVWTSTDVKGV